jgi:hypothetical protein
MMMSVESFWSILAVLKLHRHDDARQKLLERFGCFEITSA